MNLCTWCTKQTQNVLYLGLCFMVVFTASCAITNMRKTLMSSIHDDNPDYTVDGYKSLGLGYVVFTLSLLIGPSLVAALGRFAMPIASAGFVIVILALNIEEAWAVYATTPIGGLAVGIMWIAVAKYTLCNSSDKTLSRNISIFWAFYQASCVIGNSYGYYKFKGKTRIDRTTRQDLIFVLGGTAAVASVMFLFLRPVKSSEDKSLESDGPIKALKKMLSMFTTKYLLMLNLTFIFSGLQQAYLLAVYSSTLGFTESFGTKAKQLVALSGIVIAVGDLFGGGLFTALSGYLHELKYKRIGVISAGVFAQLVSYVLTYINLPNESVFGETSETSIITPSVIIALVCSFLLGFGDCCLCTQIYAIVAVAYPDDSTESFALYKLMECTFVAVGLYSANYVGLHLQVMILFPLAIIGLVMFIAVDIQILSKPQPQSSV